MGIKVLESCSNDSSEKTKDLCITIYEFIQQIIYHIQGTMYELLEQDPILVANYAKEVMPKEWNEWMELLVMWVFKTHMSTEELGHFKWVQLSSNIGFSFL